MKPEVSVIVPAYNEADRIGETLQTITQLTEVSEIVVVDDGSEDDTAAIARQWTPAVIRLEHNCGKGHALDTGWRKSTGSVIVFLDADLGSSAGLAGHLMEPVIQGRCDMTVATFPPAKTTGGFGLVKSLAHKGVTYLTGQTVSAPLSGQRAIRRRVLEHIPSLATHFGVEISLTVETLRNGFHICEVPIAFSHRETGRDIAGFMHRGRQFVDISKTLYHLWRTT